MKQLKIELDKNHVYTVNGQKVPSVTQIIDKVLGPGFRAPQWYLDRGQAVHACAALIARGKRIKYDDRIKGQVRAIKRFLAEIKPDPWLIEGRVVSQMFHYAGTVDLAGQIGNKKVIFDYKSSVDHIRLKLQLAAYSQAIKETHGKEIRWGAGVHIKEDGNYSLTELYDLKPAIREFLSLREVYKILEVLND